MMLRLSTPRPCRLLALLLFGLLVVSSATPAAAGANQENATHDSILLTPVADTYIDATAPATNFASQPTLRVANLTAGAPAEQRSLLRFDLDSLPDGAVIAKAELRLFQTNAAQDWLIDIYRIITNWDAATVTFDDQPQSVPARADVPIPAGANQRVTLDVTSLVQAWVHEPGALPNYGLLLRPGDGQLFSRSFGSAESNEPPQLFIEYQAPPDTLSLADVALPPKVDGLCDTRSEYRQASAFHYIDVGIDVGGQPYPLYLLQTPTDLFVCIQGVTGSQTSFFALYLDTDLSTAEGDNTVPNADDFSLRVQVGNGVTTTLVGDPGNPNGPWIPAGPGAFGPWEAIAATDINATMESAEFRVPLSTLRRGVIACNAPFGIGVYHQSVRTAPDAGWPVLDGPNNPSSWVETTLQNPPCPIRVCVATAAPCTPALNAQVFRAGSSQTYTVDENGYIVERTAILEGDQLWAIQPFPDGVKPKYTAYRTNGAPQTVNPTAFAGDPSGVMTLVVQDDHPLIIHDLAVSSQWLLSPEQRDKLTQQLTRTAEFLYDFTDGQFLLGDITVHQDYEAWPEADLRLYANNNLRPKATAGGVVEAELTDNSIEEPITYYPGYVHMGRYWNRYHKPEGEPIIFEGVPIDPATLVDDWSIVFGHELGHYLLFLFDTYFGVGPDQTLVDVHNCTGSAMGWVYEPPNWGFVYDPAHWLANCAGALAHQLLGRDEWATLLTHYPWLRRPTSFVPGPSQPPVGLTNVAFIEPATPSTPLPNQTFDLLYDNGESAGRKALAYLIHNERVIGQGSPPKGSTQITLTGAQAGDRFCVYDIDAAPPAPDTPRHQYGCEMLEAGDQQLDLERDPSWGPIV
ncbi:MAG TPA: DNRLRE domain-containing protein, partial [Caldilineaceae bacterium]|nr:DNRLRE domain-containing protein [Caldilineaceae bacterium]